MLLKHAGAQGGRRRIWTGRQSVTGLTHTGRQPFTLTHTPLMDVFGLWEEDITVSEENPRSCYEAAALTAAPPCHPVL